MRRCADAARLRPAQALAGRALVSLLAGFSAGAAAQEVALFNLTDVEGHVSTNYLGNRDATRQAGPAGVTRSTQGDSDWRNEVFLMTHSYVYHPNFVTLDIGGGPILQAGALETDGGTTQSRGVLYNLVGRANFLRGKPVSGALFYEHLNPVLSIAPGQTLQQETSRYGMEVAATAAALPTPLRFELTRSESNGRSDERVMHDRTDQLNLRLSRDIGKQGATQVQFQAVRQESLSGSTSLPIQSSTSDSGSLDIDTRLPFGTDGEHELLNLVSLNRHDFVVDGRAMPQQSDLNLLLDLRMKHSDALTSFGTAHYSNNDNGDRAAVTQSASSGIAWSPDKELELSAGGRIETQQAGPFSVSDRGVDAMVRRQQALPLGTLTASYRVRHDQRSQRAQASDARAIGERTILGGTSPSALSQARVVAGSVVVSNLTRSQVYVENIDYTLTTVGQTTRLQRLIGGSILDGEDVLVDYAYDLGGTFASAETDQTFNLGWSLSQRLSLYLRESRSTVEVLSGTPTFALGDSRSRLYGLRTDLPFSAAGVPLSAGATVEHERIVDPISPLVRNAADLYLQTEEPLFDLGNVGVTLHRMTMDYASSAQDMDLRGYGLRFSARWMGVDVSAVRNFECDRGGPTVRCRVDNAINAQWRERKLAMNARLAHGRETQAGFERSHTLFQISLRRDL
ncbi:hypothetical protein GPA22_17440 [Aromatoleum toluvorans]|uniref:TIGR03016 family PEP-CTERM system-associated outer membrane protein n=1 Tax=Aromatoleum toluvorans TaxID=92002 RepID=A0ABX1Q4R1_9RHOO|nr:hypothetical protein [Aromatoleum toluvorans]NMG45500.1 hypothetical protein [Aromatoleum toluvorans]